MGRSARPRPQVRLSQRPGDRARPDRHDQLHDGLRHDRHRAGHRPGEVQAARRRRHAEDRQPHRAAGPGQRWATTSRRSRAIVKLHRRARHDRRAPPISRTSTWPSSIVPSSRATASRSIAWRAHVRMMAAAQPFLSGAICKTVNMPRGRDARRHRRRLLLGLGARPQGPGHLSRRLASRASRSTPRQKATRRKPRRSSSSASRGASGCPTRGNSVTHKFNVGGHEGYINVGLFDDGRPGELFITMAKEGRTDRRPDGRLRHGRSR